MEGICQDLEPTLWWCLLLFYSIYIFSTSPFTLATTEYPCEMKTCFPSISFYWSSETFFALTAPNKHMVLCVYASIYTCMAYVQSHKLYISQNSFGKSSNVLCQPMVAPGGVATRAQEGFNYFGFGPTSIDWFQAFGYPARQYGGSFIGCCHSWVWRPTSSCPSWTCWWSAPAIGTNSWRISERNGSFLGPDQHVPGRSEYQCQQATIKLGSLYRGVAGEHFF